MASELWSKTPPMEDGWYWHRAVINGSELHEMPVQVAEGSVITGRQVPFVPLSIAGGEWGPRIPSAEELAALKEEVDGLESTLSDEEAAHQDTLRLLAALQAENARLLGALKTIAEYGEADGGPFALGAAKTARAALRTEPPGQRQRSRGR